MTALRIRGGRRLASSAGLIASRIASATLQAVQLILLARLTDAQTFGFIAVVYSAAILCAGLGDCGVSTFILKERALRPDSQLIRPALRLGSMGVAALAAVGFAATFGLLEANLAIALSPLWIWALADRGADAWLAVALADGRSRVAIVSTVGRRAVSLAGFGVLVSLHAPPAHSYSASLAVGSIAFWGWAALALRRQGRITEGRISRSLVQQVSPYWITNASAQARSADIPLVGLIAGAVSAANYAVGIRFGAPLLIAATAISSAVIPLVARTGVPRGLARQLLPWASAGVLLVVCGVAITPLLVPAALGSEYQASIPAVQWLIPGIAAAGCTIALGSILQSVDAEGFVAWNGVAFALALVAGVGLGAWAIGEWAAAAAYTTVHIAKALSLAVRLRRHNQERSISNE